MTPGLQRRLATELARLCPSQDSPLHRLAHDGSIVRGCSSQLLDLAMRARAGEYGDERAAAGDAVRLWEYVERTGTRPEQPRWRHQWHQ